MSITFQVETSLHAHFQIFNTLNWILPKVPTIIVTYRRYFISKEQYEVEIKSKERQKKYQCQQQINIMLHKRIFMCIKILTSKSGKKQ